MKMNRSILVSKLKIFRIKPLTLAAAIICIALFSSAEVFVSWTMGTLLSNTNQIMFYVVLLAVALVVQTVSHYGSSVLFNRFAVSVQTHLRKMAGRSLLFMSSSSAQRTGDVLNRVNTEIDNIYNFLNYDFSSYVRYIVSLIFGIGFLSTIDWKLTLLVLLSCIVILIVTVLFNKRIEVAHRAWRTSEAEMDVVAQDITAGQLDIKATGIEKGVLRKFDNVLQHWMKTFLHRNAVRAWNRGTSLLFMVVVFVGVPAYSVGLVIRGILTIGMVFAAIQATKMIAEPLHDVEFLISTFTTTKVNFDRIQELISSPKERTNGEEHTVLSETPIIEFSHVSFTYSSQPVLSDFSMSVNKGQMIALVGESGSGKSTTLRLISGLYDISSGNLYFGGYPITSWKLDSLRKNLAFVQQDSYLYPGSIRDNLLCGENYTDEQLLEVIDKVQLSSWLIEQENGLNTEVGEQGAHLSGGQKQRLSIARALLRNPKVMLLDEPTSALDSENEGEIMSLLRTVTKEITCLVVSHRLSSIAYADNIFVMQDGRITENGTHEELMTKKGYYYNLYVMQEKEGESNV